MRATPAQTAVRSLLAALGEDPERDGLVDTPGRVERAWRELLSGREADVGAILSRDFDADGYDQMIALAPIEFVSVCEHHMMPFSGAAAVAYIPRKRVVGLSKLARLVDAFARRLQIQERMTQQIADALEEHLHPIGCAVLLRASHTCMSYRGVRKRGGQMTTSVTTGLMRVDPKARAEFLSLVRPMLGGE